MARSISEQSEALRRLLLESRPEVKTTAWIPLSDAAGRVLASNLTAPLDLPTATNSQMDGFAVRTADLAADDAPFTLPVRGMQAAGARVSTHEPGTAMPVMTGAVIPAGANAVIPVERARPSSFTAQEITVSPEVAAGIRRGTFIRKAGSDVARGDVALPAGTVMGAAALGACAALGMGPDFPVEVRRGPRVLVISGGDEVVPVGMDLAEGAVFDANGPLLTAWLAQVGAEEVGRLRVDDTPAQFLASIDREADRFCPDLIVTSGGISAGAFEVVRQVLEVHGQMWFGHVAVQPGGPQGCGTYRDIPVVCLPGNPVSTWVSCEVFLRDALATTWGTCAPAQWSDAVAGENIPRLAERTQMRRGTLEPTSHQVRCVGGASSHLLMSAARASVLVCVPAGQGDLPAGTRVRVLHVAGGILDLAGSHL